jgi:sentrin-specific protease 1
VQVKKKHNGDNGSM